MNRVQEKAQFLLEQQGDFSDDESSVDDEEEVVAIVWNPEEAKMQKAFSMAGILAKIQKVAPLTQPEDAQTVQPQ